jgi:hypothetical protein
MRPRPNKKAVEPNKKKGRRRRIMKPLIEHFLFIQCPGKC